MPSFILTICPAHLNIPDLISQVSFGNAKNHKVFNFDVYQLPIFIHVGLDIPLRPLLFIRYKGKIREQFMK